MKTAVLFTRAPLPVHGADEVYVAGRDGLPAGWGAAVRAVLAQTQAEVLVVNPPDLSRSPVASGTGGPVDGARAAGPGDLAALTAPVVADQLDVIIGRRTSAPLLERGLERAAALVLDEGYDVGSRVRVFRVAALRAEALTRDDDGADAEALVKLHAQLYRFGEAAVGATPRLGRGEHLALLRTFVRYATVQNDADNAHEGYSTLKNLEAQAPNYNAWLGRVFAPWAGKRVLEIGAGIGTITEHLSAHAELVTALEVDPFYVRRLGNRFRGRPGVEPLQADVSLADWEGLAARRFDTIVLSNVLEHIEDDEEAVRTFGKILPVGGRVIIFVPAIPSLFGALDEAVGHFRRYTQASLRAVLEGNGFAVEHLKPMNLIGIPGWYVNGKVLRRRTLPPLQLRLYDRLAPLIAGAEARLSIPVGMSLLAVARRR